MSSLSSLFLVKGNRGGAEGIYLSPSVPEGSTYFLCPSDSQLPKTWSLRQQGDDFLIETSNALIITVSFVVDAWYQRPQPKAGPWVYISLAPGGCMAAGVGRNFLAYIPSGDELVLELPLQAFNGGELNLPIWDPRPRGLRELRQQLPLEAGLRYQFQLHNFDCHDALSLSYLRMAYPDHYFELSELPSDRKISPLWKRYCQNLGIRVGKAPRMRAEPFSLPQLPREFFAEHADLLGDLAEGGSVIPDRLLRSFLET